MADEKIVKIVAQVESNSGPSPEDQEKAAINAAIAQKRAEEAAEKNRYRAFLKPEKEESEPGKRGRPRRENVPPPPPRGRAGAPPIQNNPNDPDSPTSPEGQSRFAKAWKIFQKGVTAVNGANGHMTKTVAFLTRGFQFGSEAVKDLKDAGISASGALNAARGSGSNLAKTLGITSKGAALAGSAAGGAAMALGVAALATAGLAVQAGTAALALKILVGVTNNMTEVVGKFSASLEAARANNKVLEIQARMRSAGRIGGELASLESSKGGAERALIELKTTFVDLFSPFIKAALDFFTNMLKSVNIIMAVLNVISEWIEYGVESILELLSHIPLLGRAAKKALDWMQQDEINNIKAANGLHTQVEDLFKEENVFPTKPKKNSVANRFLP